VAEDLKIERVPIKDLVVEEGTEEILASPAMQPYIRLAEAVFNEQETTGALAAISKLPLEKRYIWRVVSALKWALCDFDSVSVKADRATLSEEEMSKVRALLQLRPAQFCLFLKALLGEEEMEQVVRGALEMAKQHY